MLKPSDKPDQKKGRTAKANAAIETLEMAAISVKDAAVQDVMSLSMAVAWGVSPAETLERLTRYLAGRLDGKACSCLILGPSERSRDLVCCADAYRDNLRGEVVQDKELSYEVRAMLDRGISWARSGTGVKPNIEIEDQPPPVLRGRLTGNGGPFDVSSDGIVVPLIHNRKVTGVIWVAPRRVDTQYKDWDVALAQTVSVLAGQAVGALISQREHRAAEHARSSLGSAMNQSSGPDELHQRFEARTRELASVAQEMRAPLGVIIGHIEQLGHLASDATIGPSLAAIQRQCNRLTALSDSLLLSNRREALSLRLEATELRPLLQGWAAGFQTHAERVGVSLEVALEPGLGTRRVDKEKLHELVEQLLSISFGRSLPGDSVRLSVRLDDTGNNVQIQVSDVGQPLTEEVLERALDGFFGDTENEGAQDFSLALVTEYVELHGGSIKARNRPDAGVSFQVTIPAHADRAIREDTNPIPKENLRVLVVDPNRDSLCLTAEALAGRFDVVTARSEREAGWLIRQLPIDCAIIDLNPPLMSGFAVASELRKAVDSPFLPALFTSDPNLANVAVRQRAEEFEDVLIRPMDPAVLGARIRMAVRDSRRRSRVADTAVVDQLSGLSTRAQAEHELEAIVPRSFRLGRPLSVLMLDIDGMDQVNEAAGRETGDQLIRQIGKALKHITRTEELTSRWGGDEFLCILSATDKDAAIVVAERLRVRLARCRVGQFGVTVSVGVGTLTPREEGTPGMLLDRVETALLLAKEMGGDQVVVFSSNQTADSPSI